VGRFADSMVARLLEAAPDATVCVDHGGRIVLVNALAEELFGYPRADLDGQPVEILVPDGARAGHPAQRAGYAADPRPRPMDSGLDLSGRRRDGSTFPAEISLSAVDTGQGLLVAAAVRDVTRQRQAALSQARLASIVESSHDAMLTIGLDGKVASWNAGAERIYGYTAAETVGQSVDFLLPAGQERTDVHKILAGLAEGERVEEYKAERVHKDGTTIAVMITLASLADKAGVVTGLSAVVRDISPQRAAARFLGLLEAAPDAMICADRDGRIVLVNAQAERLFGYPRADLDGQPVEILVPDALRAGHRARRAEYAADPRPRLIGADQDLSGRRRDGSTFPAEVSLSAVDTDQGTLISAAVRDVTIQRQARDDLRRTNRNLESLTYSIAHDLRTPLRSLAGFSTALAEEYGDVIGETGRGYTRRIEAASEHIGDVLDSLMHLSRIAQAEISLQAVDLGAEAARIAGELQRHDPGRRVAFAIQQPAWARADRALIRTVLHNLLGNAWKFTAGREDAAIEFGMTPVADARVSCFVRDNGAGFDPAYVDKLFRPFHRLHTTGEFPGTGIGLAAVREIVERHGGRTWAEGMIGHGAAVFFTLQAAPPAGPPD
jgi:PAS domain S-box-containing protein